MIKWFNDFKWIIKYGSLTNEFNLFLCKQGSEIIDELETKLSDLDLNESYILARKILISEIESNKTKSIGDDNNDLSEKSRWKFLQ